MVLNKRLVFFFISLCCIGFTSFITVDDEWKLKKFSKGVAVYSREVSSSVIKELRAETEVKTSLASIIMLLNDRETYTQWVYRCGYSKELKRINEAESIYYQTVVAPWPVDDRDFVVDVKVVQDPKTKVVKQYTTNMPEFIPPVQGHVRITEFDALWTLTPLKNGLVKCEYQLLVNPGGNVPAWMVNLAAIDGPFETTYNLTEWVKKEKYQKAKYSFIKEPE